MKTVGSYEAKTHLPALLRKVAKGERIAITNHGVPVALLQPIAPAKKADLAEIIRSLADFRKGRRLRGISIREMIEDGRRL